MNRPARTNKEHALQRAGGGVCVTDLITIHGEPGDGNIGSQNSYNGASRRHWLECWRQIGGGVEDSSRLPGQRYIAFICNEKLLVIIARCDPDNIAVGGGIGLYFLFRSSAQNQQ